MTARNLRRALMLSRDAPKKSIFEGVSTGIGKVLKVLENLKPNFENSSDQPEEKNDNNKAKMAVDPVNLADDSSRASRPTPLPSQPLVIDSASLSKAHQIQNPLEEHAHPDHHPARSKANAPHPSTNQASTKANMPHHQKLFELRDKIANSTKLPDWVKTEALMLKQWTVSLAKHPEHRESIIRQCKKSRIKELTALCRSEDHNPDYDDVGLVLNCFLAAAGQVDFSARKGSSGIRILSIDGGGTKALVAIEIMKKIEELCGKRIIDMFDIIGGTSTGAILSFMLGMKQFPLDEIEKNYMDLGAQVFNEGRVGGLKRFLWQYSYYDTSVLENILKNIFGDSTLIESNLQSHYVPKVFAVAGRMTSSSLRPYVFRNYNLPPSTIKYYEGDCHTRTWESLRASSAAPLYFDPIKIGNEVFQDGGVLINNPAALAIQEAKRIWGPSVPIEVVVSLGTGKQRFDPSAEAHDPTKSMLYNTAMAMINSATDSSRVHYFLRDTLKENEYFRLNPVLTDSYMNENRKEKLEQFKDEARIYLKENHTQISRLCSRLTEPKCRKVQFDDFIRDSKTHHPKIHQLFSPLLSHDNPRQEIL